MSVHPSVLLMQVKPFRNSSEVYQDSLPTKTVPTLLLLPFTEGNSRGAGFFLHKGTASNPNFSSIPETDSITTTTDWRSTKMAPLEHFHAEPTQAVPAPGSSQQCQHPVTTVLATGRRQRQGQVTQLPGATGSQRTAVTALHTEAGSQLCSDTVQPQSHRT